jgi:hypothetical protein
MTIVVNMNKALEIKKDMIRKERQPLFETLDVQYMRAVESGDVAKQQEIVVKKQALRDATTDVSILNAQTPEELKNARPSILDEV